MTSLPTTPGDARELRFEFDWVPAETVASRDLAATWAALAIWIGDECVTRVEDAGTSSTRRILHVSLYPLAEWIAYNWWFLTAHTRPTLSTDELWRFERTPYPWESPRPQWIARHNLRGAADGFHWPDLTLVPDAPFVRARWFPDPSVDAVSRVQFVSGGETWLPYAPTIAHLQHFVDVVVDRLDSRGVHGTSLHEEWRAVHQTDAEEAEFCRASARLGHDPYDDIAAPTVDALIQAGEQLPPRVFDDLVDIAVPSDLDDSVTWITNSMSQIRRHGVARWDLVASEAVGQPFERGLGVSDTDEPRWQPVPWRLGYEHARTFRHAHGVGGGDTFPIEDLVRPLDHESPDPSLLAIAARSTDDTTILVRGRRAAAHDPAVTARSRFVAALGVWHTAFSPARVSLVTEASTYRQRVSRAFAAELLAPAGGLEEQLGTGRASVSIDEVENLASHYRVSPLVIEHQIENQLGRRVPAD